MDNIKETIYKGLAVAYLVTSSSPRREAIMKGDHKAIGILNSDAIGLYIVALLIYFAVILS